MEFIKAYLEAWSIKLLKISFGVEETKARQKESFFPCCTGREGVAGVGGGALG